jgi:hypothetical protein
VADIANDYFSYSLQMAELDKAINDHVYCVSESQLSPAIQPSQTLGGVFAVYCFELGLMFGNLFSPVPPVRK